MSGVKNFDFPLSNGDDYSDSEEEDNPALISLMMQDLKLYKEQFLQCLSTVKEQQNLLRAFYSQLKEFYRGELKKKLHMYIMSVSFLLLFLRDCSVLHSRYSRSHSSETFP